MKPVKYQVVWRWRDDDEHSTPKVDEVQATNAQRAINTVTRALRAEYANVNREFVPLSVIRVE